MINNYCVNCSSQTVFNYDKSLSSKYIETYICTNCNCHTKTYKI